MALCEACVRIGSNSMCQRAFVIFCLALSARCLQRALCVLLCARVATSRCASPISSARVTTCSALDSLHCPLRDSAACSLVLISGAVTSHASRRRGRRKVT